MQLRIQSAIDVDCEAISLDVTGVSVDANVLIFPDVYSIDSNRETRRRGVRLTEGDDF